MRVELKYKLNREIVKEFIKKNPSKLAFIPFEFLSDIEIILLAIENCKRNDFRTYMLSPEMLDNEIVAKSLVSKEAHGLKSISKRLKNNKEIVLLSIYNNPDSLKYASKELKNDKSLITTAIDILPRTIMYSSKEIKDNDEIMKMVVQLEGCLISHASNRIKKNFEIGMMAVKNDITAIKYLSKSLRDNYDMIFSVIQRAASFIKYASSRLRNNYYLMKIALRRSFTRWPLRYGSKELRGNYELMKMSIMDRGDSLELGSKELKDDETLVFKAMNHKDYPLSLRYVSRRLKDDMETVIHSLTKNNYTEIKYASKNMRENFEIVKETFNEYIPNYVVKYYDFDDKTILKLTKNYLLSFIGHKTNNLKWLNFDIHFNYQYQKPNIYIPKFIWSQKFI
jgi:CxxC motif-containing protein